MWGQPPSAVRRAQIDSSATKTIARDSELVWCSEDFLANLSCIVPTKRDGTPASLNVLLQLPFFDSPGNKAHKEHQADVSDTGNCPSPQHPPSVYNEEHQGNSSYDEKQ